MKKAYRVKSEADFQRVFDYGKSMANRQFVIYVLDKPGQDHFRAGISVSKKLGNAPERNAIKRKIRASFQELQAHIRPDVDVIVIARGPTTEMTVAQMVSSLKHVFNLAKIYMHSDHTSDQ